MLKWKKISAILLCLCLLLTAAACNSNDSSTPSSSQPSGNSESGESGGNDEVNETALPITDEPVTFTMWKVWSNDYIDSINDIESIKKSAEETGVTIIYNTVAATAAVEKFGMLLASGDYPDMIDHSETAVSYPGGGDKAIADGVYLDMTSYVEQYMPNYSQLRLQDEELAKMTVTDSGKMWAIYMMRAQTDGALMAEPAWIGMVIRTDWLDDLGLNMPVTIDDWTTTLTAFKDEKGAEAPLMIGPKGFVINDYFASAYGVKRDFYRDGANVKYGPLENGYRQYIELMRQWYADGLIDQNFISNTSEMIMTAEYGATGKSGAGTNMWGLSQQYYLETGQTEDANIRFEAVAGPVLNVGEVCQSKFPSYIATNQISVTSNCSNPEIVAKWMDYQYTVDGLIRNYYGIEGDTYEMADGKPVYTAKILEPEGNFTTGDMLAMNVRGDGVGLNAWDRWDQAYDHEKLKAREVWDADGLGLVLPRITMTDEEGLEYNNIFTDIKTYVEEKTVAYIMGTESMDTYDAFVQHIYDLNIEKCLEIQQAALDRYNAR